ncbi:MAG TPA: glycine betaine ABC transporter substrate-binding protein [Solirubrobacteraceae bacterium]|nr:glycine betaine ABC transporter substrate-binding protein [Solirubrobacteraceae bacterium]
MLAGSAVVAVAVALGACGSSSSSSASSAGSGSTSGGGALPGKGKPPITMGDKNFTEEFILGDLYAGALRAKGFTVNLKPNIGSSELTDKSLTSGQIDMYPEYTGVILSVIKGQAQVPPTAAATYQAAKAFEQGRGFTLLSATPFFDADALITLKPFAQKNHLTTISDLKKVSSWTYGGPPENQSRYEGVVGLHKAYHLFNLKFIPLTIGLQYQALDSGKVQTAAAFTTDGQLESGKYVILTDPKHIFGFQNVAPVVSNKLLAREGPAFAQTLDAVSAKLTNHVMQQLNAAVDIDKVDPATVASKFLKANGLA